VYAQHRQSDSGTKVTEAVLTYVAVDDNRRPRVVSAQQ
jgi:acyl-CoA hydrolase